MSKIDINALTDEQRQQIIADMKAEQAAFSLKEKQEREALKSLTEEAIFSSFEILKGLSAQITAAKKQVLENFNNIIAMKQETYDLTKEQQSHTFTSKNGLFRFIIGYHLTDNFDDSHTAGVDGVNQCLDELNKGDKDSIFLVKMGKRLLARDAKGSLNARKVMTLYKLAQESEREKLIDNIKIIMDAYNPTLSKRYIICRYRDEDSMEWNTLPLGITEA